MISLLISICALAGGQGAQATVKVADRAKSIPATRILIRPDVLKAIVPVAESADLKLDLSPRALDMEGLRKNQLGYYPSSIQFVTEKPVGILHEPAYHGTPKYGAVRLGDGPRAVTYFSIDEAAGGTSHFYIDQNNNGDLTDDGSADWDVTKDDNGVTYFEKAANLRASWGDATTERETAPYTLFFYRHLGESRVNFTRFSARTGTATVAGKSVAVMLAENQSDAVFTVPTSGDITRKPVFFCVDEDGDGLFKGTSKGAERHSLDQPFQIGGAWYEAFPNVSGSQLLLRPARRPGLPAAPAAAAVARKPLLSAGAMAPDFEAAGLDGRPLRLSDFKGKIVLLDFWATWCGPCQASMPGLQKIYDQVKNKNVVVLSVNVWDEKGPYDQWIAKNSGKTYSFTFAFDAAGREPSNIAAAKFGVSGIPTMFVIQPDGKIATSIVGSGNEGAIVKALSDLGVKATVPPEK